MKHLTLALGIVAAATAAASIYLGIKLTDANEQLDREIRARSAAEARLMALEADHAPAWTAMSDAPPGAPGPVPALGPPAREDRRFADNAAQSGPMPGGPRVERAETPSEEARRRVNQEVRLRRMYADMPAALGLDAEQANKLFDLLADSRVSTFEDMRAYEGDPAGRKAIETAARAQRDASIDALLGPDKAAEFQYYEKSIPARMQVNRIGESMAAANIPLTETQRTSMIAAVVSEQDAAPAPQRTGDAAKDADYQARFLDWQADYSKRVQSRVEPLLTSEQVAEYRAAVQVQNARRAAQRTRAENRRDGNPRP
jgi:hypothetical protein